MSTPTLNPARFATTNLISYGCFLAILLNSLWLANAQEPGSNSNTSTNVAATVNGIAITTDQIERDIERTLTEIKLGPQQRMKAREATLKKLIDQRIAFEFLKKHNIWAGEDEVELWLEELKAELATVEKTIDDYLQQTNQRLDELRFQTAWQISWKRYLDRKLTDEFLESHFNQNKRQMDGTKLRVAHLLLKKPGNATSVQAAALTKKADSIYEQIKKTSLTWDEAVAEHSEAPTRDSGGEIGWIQMRGPMPRSFTLAAFALAKGEISKPVMTRFGVHLIKCIEVKAGELGWRDIIDEVKKSAARAYFDAIVQKHRPDVAVKINKVAETK